MKIKRPDWTKQIERKKSKIWVDKNENCDEFIGQINLSNIKKIKKNNIFAYPDLGKLYLLLSKNLKINYKNILITNGADGAIRLVFDTFEKKNFTVLRLEPSFAMYKIYSKIFSSKDIVINYKKKDNEPVLSKNEIIKKIKRYKPNLLLLANPNSPTGTIIKKKEIINIIKVAKKNNCLVLLDEAYYPYSKLTLINEINQYKNLVIVRSLKAFGLSGLRVGYLISNKNFVKKVQNFRPLYEINSLGAFLFSELLKDYSKVKKSVNDLILAKKYFIKQLKKRNIKFIKSFGNFTHIKIEKNKKQILNSIFKKFYIRENEIHSSLKGFSRISFTTQKNYKQILDSIDKFNYEKK